MLFLPVKSIQKCIGAFAVIIVASVSFGIAVHAQPSKVNLAELEQYIENARKDWQVPGMAVAIIKNDTVIFSKGFGLCESGKKEPVDEHTLFAIASNSKAFTAAALGTLVDEHKISWNDNVTKYLPYFRLSDSCATQQMTIRDLLSHRSGLKTFSGDLLWFGSTYTREEVIKRARLLKPAYGFRTQYGYQNIMFVAAGEIIPQVTGMSWDTYVQERFFKPLGMSRTNTSVKQLTGLANVAKPHVIWQGKLQSVPYLNYDNFAPAGAINSSVADMSKWIKLQLNRGTLNGKTFFSPDVAREMWQPQTLNPVSKNAERLWPSKHFQAYGLGWEMFDYHGRKVITHSGGLEGMISQVVMVPEEKLGFVVLTNIDNTLPYALLYEITDRFVGKAGRDWSKVFLEFKEAGKKREAEAKQKAEKEKPAEKITGLPLKKYEGVYESKLYGKVTISKVKNNLVLQMVPTPTFTANLVHDSQNTFLLSWSKPTFLPGGKVTFVTNAQGIVTELKIDVPNPDFDFTELELKKVN